MIHRKIAEQRSFLFGVLLVFLLPVMGRALKRRGGSGVHSDASVEKFYTTWIWRKCRKAFAESKGNLCERCLQRGILEPGSKDRPLEVHHKISLTAENVKNPQISLNWSNLELLCKTCHDAERERKQKRWTIGQDGKVIL